jgi:sugar lactone lactonase YvrE
MKKIITLLALVFCVNAHAQIISTVAGGMSQGGSGDGGQATAAYLFNSHGVAVDAAGNLYIADCSNNRIRKVNTAGIINTIAGSIGVHGYTGDGGQATAAKLYGPGAIVIDVAGNLYFTDQGNVIRKINTAGIINTIVGNGTFGFSGDGGQATAAMLNSPYGLALDAANNLYINDAGNDRIRKVNSLGVINTIAGTGLFGFSGDGGQATSAKFNSLQGITIDTSNNIYVADDKRVRMINMSGIINTIAGNGTNGFSGDGGQATAAMLNSPYGLALDATNNLYISDVANQRIRMVNTLGVISTVVGNGTSGYTGDGGSSTAAEIDAPSGLVVDGLDNLYFCQSTVSIRKVTNISIAAIPTYNTQNSTFKIYPNPSSTNFVIEPSSTDKQTLQVFDVNGKLVLTQTINGKTNIDVSTLAEGVYNLSVQNPSAVINKRLVIVR